jgi:DNA-binding NarL/FixJ family response regulator
LEGKEDPVSMNKPISLAIADDQQLFRKGLIALLADYPGISVTIEASNGQDLLSQLEDQSADVVLLDLQMPHMNGIETTQKLHKKNPDTKILILTSHNEEELIKHLILSGAHGFLLKDNTLETIVEAISGVTENGYYFNERVSKEMVSDLMSKYSIRPVFNQVSLSARETEIVRLMSQEYTNKEISEKLSISVRTVETHRDHILQKTNAKNSVGIIMYAYRNNIISY